MTPVQPFPTALRAIACLLFISTASAVAQDRLDPVAMGKARASVATVRGIGAVASNPGALDLGTMQAFTLGDGITVSIYNIGGTVGSTYLSSSDFQQIFGKSTGWPNQDERKRLGELLQDERLFANGANNLIAARYQTSGGGTFGLHYGHRAFARLNFPDDFSRVISKGELLLERYRFINRGVGAQWFTELGLSYGKSFGSTSTPGWFQQVGVGATLKLLGGIAELDVDENSFIAIDQKTLDGTRAYVIRGGYTVRSAQPADLNPADAVSKFIAAMFPSTSGSGFAGDVGISGVLYRKAGADPLGAGRDAIYFGIALHDVGSIHWTDVAYERSQTNINDTLRNGTLSNDQFKAYQGTLRRGAAFTTRLPSSLRAGIAVNVGAYVPELVGAMTVDLEGELPLNDLPGNAADPRLSVGVDWDATTWLALRTGLSGGGISGFGVGLGFGLKPWPWLTFDLGTSELNGIFSGERLDLAARLTAGF